MPSRIKGKELKKKEGLETYERLFLTLERITSLEDAKVSNRKQKERVVVLGIVSKASHKGPALVGFYSFLFYIYIYKHKKRFGMLNKWCCIHLYVTIFFI